MILTDLNIGDTDYVSKINGNNAALIAVITQIQTLISGSSGASTSYASFLDALFGNNKPVKIGLQSYSVLSSGSQLTVKAGTAWKASTQQLVASPTDTVLNFSAYAAGTLYVSLDGGGTPIITSSSSDSLYSVVWQGAAFGAITPLADSYMTSSEEGAALFSSKYNQTYSSLQARLDHIESLLP